jgi:hypothetical protein
MESRNKSDDRSRQTLLLVRGVGRLSFLLVSDQNVEQKKMKKKGTIFVEIDEVLLIEKTTTHTIIIVSSVDKIIKSKKIRR